MGAWTADFRDVFDTMFGNESTGGGEEIVTLRLRDAGDEEGQTADETEMWGQGCFLYRPAPPNDDGKCQALVAQIGPRKIAMATRDSRASKVFGALNPGDAVFGSPTGKVMVRANNDGSIALRKAGEGDAPDSWVSIDKDGGITIGNAAGQIELTTKNGFLILMEDGSFFQLKNGKCIVSTQLLHALGSLAQGQAPMPLATTPFTGTVGAGFAPVLPVQGLMVTPG